MEGACRARGRLVAGIGICSPRFDGACLSRGDLLGYLEVRWQRRIFGALGGVHADPLGESLDLSAQDVDGEIPQIPFDRVERIAMLPLCLFALFGGLSGFGLIRDVCCRAEAAQLFLSVAPLDGKALGAGSGPHPDLGHVGQDEHHIFVHDCALRLARTERDTLAVDRHQEFARSGRLDRGDRGLGAYHR